jgi:hypothetical protein
MPGLIKTGARREIEEAGVVADPFLAADPDCPVFGFNLACAFPFPAEAARWFRPIAERLAALDAGVYVYPAWETHVTIITFVNFSLHRRPDPALLARLQSFLSPVHELVRPLVKGSAFTLELGPPLLTRKGAILPITDAMGAIARLRQSVTAALASDGALHAELSRAGLNVPAIIHSTIMRFREAPSNLPRFLEEFDRLADNAAPFALDIGEILLTTETRPYMREGVIAQRYPLSPRPPFGAGWQ